MAKPSVILLGSKPGSVVAFSMLVARGWDVKAVVVTPKYNRDWIAGPTLEMVAAERGVPVLTSQDGLAGVGGADFVISYMFRLRVKAPTLALARRAPLNFHAGPLPEYGGWAFYNVAILENATEYGCTCHYMDEGFDTGPLLRVARFPIDPRAETAVSLERKAQARMVGLFHEFCMMAESGHPLPIEAQDRSKMRYLKKEEFEALKEIPPGADHETIQRHARAFWSPPYECAYVKVGGVKVEIVPDLVKDQLARFLHADELESLRDAARRAAEGERS
jgi:methionyl-tRNA formyltransferase